MVAPVTAMADGFTKAQGLLDKVSTGLLALSIVTVTIATLWVGYKVLFGGKPCVNAPQSLWVQF